MSPPSAPGPLALDKFAFRKTFDTRTNDNVGGHLFNVTIMTFFDNTITSFLSRCGVHGTSRFRRLVIKTEAQFLKLVEGYPNRITVGLSVTNIGKTSMEIECALFENTARQPKAVGHSIQVVIDTESNNRPSAEGIDSIREYLESARKERAKL